MTTQHAPHTPLWRQVLSLPHTRLGWWAVGLSGPALVLMAFTNVLGIPNTDTPQLEIWGIVVSGPDGTATALAFFGWLVSALVGGVVGFIAVARDRSLLLLVAQVPGLIIFSFVIWIPLSMLQGGETGGLTPFSLPIAVLLWAIANLALMLVSGSFRKSGESRQ